MLSPALALTGVVVAFTLSVLLFYFQILSYTTFFFFLFFMLIAYHTLVMQIITPQRPNKKPWPVVIKKSVGKYLFWLGLIGALCGVYKHHPFYVNFAAHTISMIEVFFKWYLIAAPFYFLYV